MSRAATCVVCPRTLLAHCPNANCKVKKCYFTYSWWRLEISEILLTGALIPIQSVVKQLLSVNLHLNNLTALKGLRNYFFKKKNML